MSAAKKPAPLSFETLQDLKRSGLNAKDAALMRIQDVSGEWCDENVGQHCPGYVIPYTDFNGKVIDDVFRVRQHIPPPRMFAGKTITSTFNKYMQPKDSGVFAYLSPCVDWQTVLKNPSISICLTEGEKKSFAACKAGIVTVGLGGVYNFCNDGVLLPELEQIATGRPITICFDSDRATNKNIQKAEIELATRLREVGGKVRIATIPSDGDKKIGLDDLLVAKGKEAVETVLESAVEFTSPHDEDDVSIESLTDEWLDEMPPPQEWLWGDWIPRGSVTAGNAEGGVGKTWFALRLAEACAHGSEHFMTYTHNARALRQGTAVFVHAEDPPSVIRRRLWAIQQRKVANMARTMSGPKLKTAIAEYRARLQKYFKRLALVGKKFSLVTMKDGQMVYGPGLGKLIAELRKLEDVALVVLDPLARLHTCEENSNTVNTMLINAGERIAQEFNCAVLILHHVSKDAAGKGNVSAHSGRGGSAFGDGARSVLRLIAAKPDDVKGLKLIKSDATPIDPRDLADDNVIVLHHAKSSYGPRQHPLFLLRDRDTGELLPLKAVTDERDLYTEHLDKLSRWLADNPMVVVKQTFRDATALRNSVFGSLSKNDWLLTFDTAVTKGDLIQDPIYKNDNPKAIGYMLADKTRHTRRTPASGSAGLPSDGDEEAEAGTPAATPNCLGGGCPSGGCPEGPKDATARPLKASKAAAKRQGFGGSSGGAK